MTEKEFFKIVKDGYNRIAKRYYRDRDLFVHDKELERYTFLLATGSSLLDIGCGGGVPVCRYLIDRGFKVTGIDFSEGMLKLARQNCPEAQFIRMNMAELSFADSSFDGISAFYSIIHLPRKLHQKLFQEMHRILRPGGMILVCNGADAWEAVDEYYDTKMFWSHYASKDSLELVKKAGFEIIFDEVLKRGGEQHYWVLARSNK